MTIQVNGQPREVAADTSVLQLLEELGVTTAEARRTVKLFGRHDEARVRQAYVYKDDEKALMESSKKYAEELEQIFQQDEPAAEE